MNHKHRKPYIPPPPALPRFALPNEANEAIDPLDAAATAQRPTISSRPRRVVRRVRPLQPASANATEEVAVEDILLEAYAEDPPPPMTRRSPSLPASVSIAAAIASVAPPPPVQSAAVDALLRASDPAFAPYPPQGQGYVHVPFPYPTPTRAFASSGADFESPSVAPVMLATTAPPGTMARPILRTRAPRTNRGVVLAIWSVVLVVVGVAAGVGIVLGLRDGMFSRLRERAASLASPSAKPAPIAAAAPAQPPAPAPAQPPAPAPAPTDAVSIDSLPKSPIPPDAALVTLPPYAQGHRVFLDGRMVAVADGAPLKIKCGRHMLKIGSARRPRIVDLTCGREVVIAP